jgi:folylpolyglutamate synthase/dihydropteroate synthase
MRGGAKLFKYNFNNNWGKPLGLKGDDQRKNAYLAWEVLRFINPKKVGGVDFANVSLPGRFERRVWLGREAIFDMAHTVDSAVSLRETLDREFPGRKFLFIMSFLKDKNAAGIIEALKKEVDLVWLYPLQHERAIGREELEKLRKVVERVEELPDGFVPVVCGSGYLVSALGARKAWLTGLDSPPGDGSQPFLNV